MFWIDDLEIDNELDGGGNLPSEILHKWVTKACESLDDLDVAEAGLKAKIAERQSELATVQDRREKRKAYIMRYLEQLPEKELIVNGDKFKLIESKATKVDIIDESSIHTNYCKYTMTTDFAGFVKIPEIKLFGEVKISIDKTKIKADCDNGVEVAGTKIVPIAPTLKKNNKGV
jgi:hypothetical protein